MATENRKQDTDAVSFLSETGLSFCQIKELMSHMKKEGVTAFAMGEGKTCLSLTREKEIVYVASGEGSHANSGMPIASWNAAASDVAENNATATEVPDEGYIVTSPVVGVFYDAPSPDQPAYISIGDYVKKGDVVCIVEAMKLMNEVTTSVSGRVTEILVAKASRVEFGQKLIVIDPSAEEMKNE